MKILLGLFALASAGIFTHKPSICQKNTFEDGGDVTITEHYQSDNEAALRMADAATKEWQKKEDLSDKLTKLKPSMSLPLKKKIVETTLRVATTYKVDPILLVAVAYKESNLDPKTRGNLGEYGLMQIMPFWADELPFVGDERELAVVETNIEAGAYILSSYMDRFKGNKKLALTAYNRGPEAVNRSIANGKSPYNGYAEDVLTNYKLIARL